jgi:hypothetical protein
MNARVKIHVEKLMGAIPISIVEAVHGQCTRVLTIPIAVELEDKYSYGVVEYKAYKYLIQLPYKHPIK